MNWGGAMARNKPDGTYTTTEVASKVGVADTTVRRWVRVGVLTSTHTVKYGKTVVHYFSDSDVVLARQLARSTKFLKNRVGDDD